jgi:sigma-B regulation protein RsbU (phosphoserine phosphatase)
VNLPWIKKTLEGSTSPLSVAETITKTNRLIVPGLRPNSFVSLFYAMLNVSTGRIQYVNAGSVPPLHYFASSGEVQALEPTGPVMGTSVAAKFEDKKTILEPGDVLLVFTDGVTSAATTWGEEFAEEGVRDFLVGAADLPAEDIAEALFNRILIHEPKEKRDDLSILVIKAEGVLEG